MANYIITSKGELKHWGIKGMRWGVRRYQNADGTLTAAGKRRSKYITDLDDRKQSRRDDAAERKKKIDADIKEADERVKFYGSKRAAKAAIADEAKYARKQNRGKAFLDTLKWGGGGSLALGTLGFGAGILARNGVLPLLGLALPLPAVAAVSAAFASKANHFINKHARDQVIYTDESEYGHDIVVAMKKTK